MSQERSTATGLAAKKRALLAQILKERGIENPAGDAITRRADPREMPLSFAQPRLWFLDQLEPESPRYNIFSMFQLQGTLQVPALERSLTEILRRHEALRARFIEVDGQPELRLAPAGPFPLTTLDLGGLSPVERASQLKHLALGEAQHPFHLAEGPLVRATLLRLDAEEHVLLLSMHHIVSDGWSMEVLTRELWALYQAYREGKSSPLPALEIQYADFAAWQRRWLQGAVLEGQLSYWRRQLEGLATLEFPTDRPRPPVQGFHGASRFRLLPARIMDRMRALSQGEGVTLYMALLAVFAAWLRRSTGQDDIAVGSPIANRPRAEVEGLIGFFANTLVLRTDLSGDPTFRELLGRVRDVALAGYAHEDVPFEKLVEELNPKRHLSRSPLFQVAFVLQTGPAAVIRLPGLTIGPAAIENPFSKFDLTLYAVDADPAAIGFEYSTDLFEAATVDRMLGQLETLLDGVASDPGRRVSELPLLSADERQALVAWNATDCDYPHGRQVHELIEAQAERAPEAVALVFAGGAVRYRELNARANRLAHRLRALGVGPETRVGICMARSVEMVVGLLGILKAGGAYVPLDASYPPDRLAYMLDDAGCSVVVTLAGLLEKLPPMSAPTLCLDRDDEGGASPSDTNLAPIGHPEGLAYVMYTSGSTGRPKGVMVTHRSLVNYLSWAAGAYAESGGDALVHSPLAFDLTVTSLVLPLVAGETVELLPEGEIDAVADRLRRGPEIGLLKITPAHVKALSQMLADGEGARWARMLVVGGDALYGEDLARVGAQAPETWLVNEYGPTETVVGCCVYQVRVGSLVPGPVPIGRPIANTRLYVVDEHLNPAPFGVRGELLIGGAGVSRGYWSRPDLTAERFIPDPFGPEPGARLYRTGDLVRHRADGNLEYLGRIDQQVKVRGFRIEPGEIESVLGQHPAVKDSAVIARDDPSHEKRLVAYVVPRTPAQPSFEELREHLRRSLPEYMVPSSAVFLGELPLTPNGKLDRSALPEPGADREARHRLLRTPVEEALAGIWERVLGVSGVGAEENFFELGGHSLMATRVVSQVRKTFAVELPLRALFEVPTVRGLAQRIEAARGAGRALPPPIERVERGAGLPLSFAQQRLWFLDQFGEGSAYHMPVALRLRGDLDERALVASLEELLKRHGALRTRFESAGGREVQVIEPTVSLDLQRLDLCGLPDGEREAEAKRLLEEEVSRPFDLSRAPLMRTKLLRVGEGDHVLVVTLHHIVSDGWSGGVLTRELGELYRGYRSGNASSLPEPGIQYADYAVWQRAWLSGEVLEEQLDYWRRHLSGVSVLQLPTDRPRPAEQSLDGSCELEVWSGDVLKGLKSLSHREGATLFMVLLAAFQVLLRRWTGQDDVAVGTPIANRTRSEVEGVVGFFVNSLVLRTDLSGNPTFRELVARVKEVSLGAYDHQDLPFEKLVEELEPERDLSRNPLFQVMFALQNGPVEELQLPGLSIAAVDLPVRTTHFDLELHMAEVGGSLVAAVTYRTDLFVAETVRRVLGHYGRLLQAVAADASRRVSELSLLTSAERERTLVEWNATGQEYLRESSISDLFAAQVQRTPEALAVVSGRERLSYGELHRRSNQLARHLRGLGVGPEVRVGICVERSVEMVVGLLGILKAGGAYVPLDPSYPKERLGFMLEDSGVPVLLAQERLLGVFPEHEARVVCLDRDWGVIAGESVEDVRSGALGENVAYAIYTSGSTGRPKGVLVAHGGLVNLALWHSRVYEVGPGERGTQLASPGFDASVWEVWPYLMRGASLHIPDEETRSNPSQLVTWLAEEGITHTFLPTPLAEAVLKESGVAGLGLRYLLTGGDKLHRVDTSGLPFRLVNHYGPTESTVVATCVEVGRGGETNPPIGRPIWNTRAYVLDEGMAPVPIGVAGELYIGGDGLARGYLNRPELTGEKFVPDPFSQVGGERLYRTGDLVRWLGDGTIEFLGRTDHQVKVRGFRIELGEVESVLAKHPGVKDVVVVVREEHPGDKRLVAYLVPGSEDASLVAELRQYAKGKLPGHMVPSAFVLLAALPLSPNGKLDRRALPAPEGPGAIEGTDEAPRSEVEKRIAAVWKEVLGVERVGVRDNFFDLGGHSLLLLQVHKKLRAELPGRDLSVMDLFRYSTVQSLAEHLSGGQAISGARMLERARRRRDGRSADIAVVAMAGRFPGASGVEEFWKNLRGGVESISFFSDEELRAAGVPGALLRDERYVKARAVLDGVDLFDAGFFGYSPREAEVIDPQQRLFLETAWEALERGGYSAEAYEGLIGVYAGVGINNYWHNLSSNPEVLAAAGGFTTLIGSDKDFLPTRVSYKLNLQGPSVTVQTACSTSLVAVHMACQSLLSHECDMALAGGVSIGLPQKAGYRYQEEGIASPDGHCRAFDAKARGTVSGSGVGIVLLKRLEDALREGDTIEAVIKGSAINNDGSNKVGYTAPGVAGQAAAIAVAQMVGEVEPDTIGYIEAHGTGTTLGDPIEIEALKQVFGPQTRKGFCAIGSLKTNIGHLDAAAGVAGLIKTVLSLKHGELPPSLHYEEPNPKIDFKNSPFFVNDRLRPWPRQGGPRRAGVSSFGIGGTNAHVVLEEAPAVGPSDRSRPWQLLVVSAKSEAAVKVASAQLGEHLREHPEQELADVAYTLRTGRRAFIHRRAVVCLDADDARAALGGGDPRRVLEGVVEESGGRGVAFLFPGQGSQHVGMCAGIYGREATFREEVDRCAEHLRGELGFDLREVLYPGEAGEEEAATRLGETNVTQPALFVVEWSLAKLWMAWGVKPEAMLGHSIGEYVAACLAGVFSLEDALSLVALRGRLMQGMPKGSMSAVRLEEQEVVALLDGSLGLAAINGPSQCVVSGPEEAVESLETRFHARGVEYQRLRTSHAFHSPMMEPVLSAFRERVSAVERQAPKIPFVSNLSGTWIAENEAMDPGYWARHLRETVRFGAGLSEILKERPRVLLEVGPGQALRGLARQHPECGPEQVVVASARHSRESRPDEQVLLEALGRLWLAGMDVDWTAVHADERRRRVPLPTYPFERKRYWVEASKVTAAPGSGSDKKPDIADWFYLPTWFRSMAPRVSGVATPMPASWLVFADGCGLASGMARRLEETGHRVFSVEAGEGYLRRGEHAYQIDPRRREDYDALVGDLRARGEQPERIVHLWSLTRDEAGRSETREIEEAQDLGFTSLLLLAQALGTGGAGSPVKLSVFTNGVQDVTGAETLRPEKATVLGPCLVIPQEYASVRCRSIDVELPASGSWAESHVDQLVNEALGEGPDVAVAYRHKKRWVQGFKAVRVEGPEGVPARLREGGVYLITGGLGGVGLELAQYLARTVKAKLVLVGRSRFPRGFRMVATSRGWRGARPRGPADPEASGDDRRWRGSAGAPGRHGGRSADAHGVGANPGAFRGASWSDPRCRR